MDQTNQTNIESDRSSTIKSRKDEDRIKIYLKIKKVKLIDKQYYRVSDNKQTFTLYDPLINADSSKNKVYDLDQIFTNEENSYIYEEITRNCINDSINGNFNYTYISYGESLSEKNEIIFGDKDCYKNINTRGIFPRLLENILNKINSDKTLSENIILNLSYICVNKNKLIDLSKLIGKDFAQINNQDHLMRNYSTDIKLNPDIIKTVKKVTVDNINEVIFFLSKVFDLFYKLEIEDLHLLSRSHFSFILYLSNNEGKRLSTIAFIILASSDILPTTNTNPKDPNKGKMLQNTKTIVDNQFTYENVINNIKLQDFPQDVEQSKLLIVLSKVAFEPRAKRKFRFIGNIFPNTGVHHVVKDTLDYLFQCKKIIKLRITVHNKITSPEKINENENERDKVDIQRDDVIFDLESKLKAQVTKIKELSERLEYKEKQITQYKENYKKQVECLKDAFNFSGNVNVLLSGNEYTKESASARKIRDAMEDNRIKTNRINELQKKIKELQEEVKKYQTLYESAQNDEMMTKLYMEVKQGKMYEEKLMKLTSDHSKQIDELKRKNISLEKVNEGYKNEIENQTKIIHSLPNYLQNNQDKYDLLKKVKDETSAKEKKNFKKELNIINKNMQHEYQIKLENFEASITHEKQEYNKLNELYNDLKLKYDADINSRLDEGIRLKDTLDQLISTYKICFDPKKYGTNINSLNNFNNFLASKREFDEKLSVIQESINQYQYPLVCTAINLKGANRQKTRIYALKKKPQEEKKNSLINFRLGKHAKSRSIERNDDFKSLSIEKVESRKTLLFDKIKSSEELDDMDKMALLSYTKDLTKKIKDIEEYAEKYIKYNKGYTVKEFEFNDKLINELYAKIEKYRKMIEDQVNINNKNRITIESNDRLIERLRTENFLLKGSSNVKSITKNLNFPLFTESPNKIFSSSTNNSGRINTFGNIRSNGFTKEPIKFKSKSNIRGASTNGNLRTRPMTSTGFYKATE